MNEMDHVSKLCLIVSHGLAQASDWRPFPPKIAAHLGGRTVMQGRRAVRCKGTLFESRCVCRCERRLVHIPVITMSDR